MRDRLFWVVSDTTLVIRGEIVVDHPAHQALLEWCRTHGMDPEQMPADQVIRRDVARCRVEYDRFVLDREGHRQLCRHALANGEDLESVHFARERVHAQGETPPLPFPAELRSAS